MNEIKQKEYMALKFFELPASNGSDDLLFFNEWKETSSYEEGEYDVVELIKVRSGKGYVAKTESFIVFLWGNSSTTKYLIQALDLFVQKGTGSRITVVVDSTMKEGYALAADEDEPKLWYCIGGKYTQSETTVTSGGMNPFLNTSSSSPQNPSVVSISPSTKRTRSSRRATSDPS
jgi:hypothetical protein